MPPKRHGKARRQQETSSDSDSDSSDGYAAAQFLAEGSYRQLELAAALSRPEQDYAVAAAELTAILRHLYSSQCSKAVQAMIVEDVALAIDSCDTRLQNRRALAALLEAAERCLPQAKRSALQRQYRKSSVQLRRQERRCGGSGWAGEGGWESDDECSGPASFSHLPAEVMEQVFRYLDPVTLSRAACVCREWQAAAYDDRLWQPHCRSLLHLSTRRRRKAQAQTQPVSSGSGTGAGGIPGTAGAACTSSSSCGNTAGLQQSLQQPPDGKAVADSSPAPAGLAGHGGSRGCGSSNGDSFRQQFVATVQRDPGRLLPWRSSRVIVGGRLQWRPAAQVPYHTAISTEGVIEFLKHGRWAQHGSRASSSGSDSSSSDEGDGGLSQQLRFWQL